MSGFSGGTVTQESVPRDVQGLRYNLSSWLQGMGPQGGYNGQFTTPRYTGTNMPAAGSNPWNIPTGGGPRNGGTFPTPTPVQHPVNPPWGTVTGGTTGYKPFTGQPATSTSPYAPGYGTAPAPAPSAPTGPVTGGPTQAPVAPTAPTVDTGPAPWLPPGYTPPPAWTGAIPTYSQGAAGAPLPGFDAYGAFAPTFAARPGMVSVPGWGNIPIDQVSQFFMDRYGSPVPPPGTPAVPSGLSTTGGVQGPWYGPAPTNPSVPYQPFTPSSSVALAPSMAAARFDPLGSAPPYTPTVPTTPAPGSPTVPVNPGQPNPGPSGPGYGGSSPPTAPDTPTPTSTGSTSGPWNLSFDQAGPEGPFSDLPTAASMFQSIFASPVTPPGSTAIAGLPDYARTNLAPTPTTQSVSEIAGGPNSYFANQVLSPYDQLFNQQRREALAQAKESAGNLTGSGLGNVIGSAVNRTLPQQQAQLSDILTGLTTQELGRQQNYANNSLQQLLAQGGINANMASQIFGAGTQRNSQQAALDSALNQLIYGTTSQTNTANASNFLNLLHGLAAGGGYAPTTVNTPSALPSTIGGILSLIPYFS